MSDVPKKWSPSPAVAGAVSFFFPGIGQILCGQTFKGRVLFAFSVITCWGFGLAPFVLGFDAYKQATRLQNGEEIKPWSFF